MARWHDGDLPGVDNNQAPVQVLDPAVGLLKMLSQLIDAVDVPLHIGVAAAAKPAPEIDNQFEEAGGNASLSPAAHTLIPSLRLT